MKGQTSPGLGDRAPGPSERVDEACDQFEAAWRAGPAPRIEDYLAAADEADRQTLLGELVALERELRRGCGERPGVEEYLDRFPDHAGVVRTAFGARPGAADGPAPRPHADTGRNLLFGILALQNNFIGRDDLLAAFAAWVADKARPLAQLLVDRGALDVARRMLLEALVAEHLKQHGGDPEASLAAVSSLGSVRDDLERLDDADLQASLANATQAAEPRGDAKAIAASTPAFPRAGARFRILRFHRQGGLGRVYVARDEELGREVALKEIRPDMVGEAGLRGRFVLEAEINGGLEHPGIVPVYSLGTYDDGRPFYAMRFVEGDSLKEAIESYHEACPQPDPSAVEFRKLLGRFIDVCEAIAFAHSKGVLHRDLKPHNVMLGRFGETLLIDWGVAKATGHREPVGPDAAREATLVPPSGSGHAPTLGAIGSPPYMSPEQAAGEVESLGPATDVYGLGAILFALLTGETPVEGGERDEVLDRVRRGAIRSPRSLNPNIPRALEAVCLKALAPRPVDRYPTALALAEEVEHWLADEPVTAWREPVSVRAQRWARRHRTAVAAAGVALVAGLLGLAAVAVVQAQARARLADANGRLRDALAREESANATTARALDQARREADKSRAINDFLTDDLLAQAEPENNAPQDDVTLREVLDRAADKVGDRFAGRPEVEDAVRRTIAGAYHGLGAYNEAERHWRAVLESSRRRLGPEAAATLIAQSQVGHLLFHLGRSAEGLALMGPATDGLSRALGPDHADTLTSRNNLANALSGTGRSDEAIRVHQETLRLDEAKLGQGHTESLTPLNNLAVAYEKAGRYPEAITIHEMVLRRRESEYGPDHPSTLVSRNNLAVAYEKAGQYAEAAAFHEVTLRMLEAKLGPSHPTTLISRNNLAEAYRLDGRILKAAALHEETLRMLEAKFGPEHPATLTSRNNLANAYRDAGRTAEAIRSFEAMLPAARRVFGPGHTNTLTTARSLSLAYESQGRWADAEALRHDLLARRRELEKPESSVLAGDLAGLGFNLLKQNKWSKAETVLRECLAIREKAIPNDWLRFNTISQLGAALLGQGRYAEAEPLIVDGYRMMKTLESRIPHTGKARLSEAAERVVRLYEAWGKPEQAAAWKEKLGLTDLPADVFATP